MEFHLFELILPCEYSTQLFQNIVLQSNLDYPDSLRLDEID